MARQHLQRPPGNAVQGPTDLWLRPLPQNNLPYEDAKTLSGLKPALVEILEDDDGDTYRAVYKAHFEDVLHCFKMKSTKGRSLPSRDKETIEARLAEVKKIEAEKAKLTTRGS